MKYLKITGFLSLIIFFASCEDFFDQTTTIDIPPHTPKLGVTALWIGEGNNQLVTVFSSVGVLEDETSTAVSGADIVLTENGNSVVAFVVFHCCTCFCFNSRSNNDINNFTCFLIFD